MFHFQHVSENNFKKFNIVFPNLLRNTHGGQCFNPQWFCFFLLLRMWLAQTHYLLNKIWRKTCIDFGIFQIYLVSKYIGSVIFSKAGSENSGGWRSTDLEYPKGNKSKKAAVAINHNPLNCIPSALVEEKFYLKSGTSNLLACLGCIEWRGIVLGCI